METVRFGVYTLCVLCSLFRATAADRTIVMIHKTTVIGEELFLRGGTHKGDSIPITHPNTARSCNALTYNIWREGDNFLDWLGGEATQGYFFINLSLLLQALGTPMWWTSNNPGNDNYYYANTLGDHYWIVDMNMDCSSMDVDLQGDPWFEIKAIIANQSNWLDFQWEQIPGTQGSCGGTAGSLHPFGSILNHAAKCGKLNIFIWGDTRCTINEIPQRPPYYSCYC